MQASFFIQNRQNLLELIGDHLVVLTAYTRQQQRGDTSFVFMQEANFLYLSGIDYPDWKLIIDGKNQKSWLVAPYIDASHQLFDGSLSFDMAKKMSGIAVVIDQKAGKELLRELSKKYSSVYTLGTPSYARYVDFSLNPAPKKLQQALKRQFNSVQDCTTQLAKLRAIKRPAELEAISQAATFSADAFAAVKEKLPNCRYEYELEAELTYYFRRHNAQHAFEPIIAGGKNACTLHYVANDAKIGTQQLVLIDAGARQNGYPADITRTFGVGELSLRQVAVHTAVKEAEQKIIALCTPGLSVKDYLQKTDLIMKEALLSLGLMNNRDDEVVYRRYFPHAVSHGLGIDVHDSLGGFKEFIPGMVITVEPGIYIPEEAIGVRIEDDVVITENGHQNITAAISTEL